MNDLYEEYLNNAHGLIWLTTAVDNQPSIRIVSFAVDPEIRNKFYIVTNPESPKVNEIKQNNKAGFSTNLVFENGTRVSSNNAVIKISDKKWEDVATLFDNPGFKSGHPEPEKEIILEMEFESALLLLWGNEKGTVEF
jgi:general stress protein 26